MGHQRLGKLPAYRLLPEIIQYLVSGGTPAAALVDQVTEFGGDALKAALKDKVFIEALWLLISLPQAAAAKDVPVALAAIGMKDADLSSVSDVLVAYDRCLERAQRGYHSNSTDSSVEIARRAGISALGETLRSSLPVLWAPTAD